MEEEQKTTRKRRTKDELVAALEEKLKAENERHEKAVQEIKAKIEKAKIPPKPRMTKKQKEKAVIDALVKEYGGGIKLAEALGKDVNEILNS